MKWNRADELLPEKGERVLCLNKFGSCLVGRIQKSDMFNFLDCVSEAVVMRGVEYWAYIEKPNKERYV